MKNSQKGFIIPLIISIIAVLAIGGVVFVTQKKEVKAPIIIDPISTTTNPIVGGDSDIHGCKASAGYSWCAVKNKCLRVWEEKCEVTPINSGSGDKDGFVACTMDAMMCPDGSYVGRSAPDCKFICPNN
jgi:hypothetical protein